MNLLSARPHLLLMAFGLLFLGCKDAATLRQEEVARIAAAHELYTAELEMARAMFEAKYPTPQEFDYGTNGTLILREAEIAGLPGSEKLWIKFTFINQTGLSIPKTQVVLTLRDDENELEWSETMELVLPFALRLGHNSSYSSFFEMPLHGLHRKSDWSWRLDLVSERAEFPGTSTPH